MSLDRYPQGFWCAVVLRAAELRKKHTWQEAYEMALAEAENKLNEGKPQLALFKPLEIEGYL